MKNLKNQKIHNTKSKQKDIESKMEKFFSTVDKKNNKKINEITISIDALRKELQSNVPRIEEIGNRLYKHIDETKLVLEESTKRFQAITDTFIKLNEKIDSNKLISEDEYDKHVQILNNIGNEVKEIHDKVNSILMIKVNGKIGLEEGLRAVYEATKSVRANTQLIKSLRFWIINHPIFGLLLKNRIFIISISILILWLFLSILQSMGLDINVIQILVSILKKFI